MSTTTHVKQQTHKAQIQLYGKKIYLRSNDRQIITDIAKIYPHSITYESGISARYGITIIKNDGYHILQNNALLFATQNIAEAVTFLEWLINSLFIKNLNRFLHIHAGSVAFNRRGILFPATNDVGKSTFTHYLLHRGFHYFSDEIGLIDPQTKRIFPFPKSIGLDTSTFKGPRDHRQGSIAVIQDAPKMYYQPTLRKKDVTDGVPLTHIFFLKRNTSARPCLQECSTGTAVIEVIANSFTPLAHGERGFDRLMNVLTGVKTFYLNISNLKNACQSMSEVITS